MPEIIDGARGPRSETTGKPKRNPGETNVDTIPPGKRMFGFKAFSYRVQITAPQDERLPDGRTTRAKRALVAQAQDGILVLDVRKDKALILTLEGGVDVDGVLGLKGETIDPHKDYGVDFWDIADKIAEGKSKKEEDVLQYVLKNASPEAKERILEALTATREEEFALPKDE